MKKFLFLLISLMAVYACSRDEILFPDEDLPRASEWYFSRVRYYGAPRQGETDTTWTLKMISETMKNEYWYLNGYVYEDRSPHWIEIGQLWEKKF
jgi:hypothetical protein